IGNIDDYFDVQEEIEDRFGNIPKSVQMLLEIVLIKAEAHVLDILSITQKQSTILVSFKGDAKIDPIKIVETVAKRPKRYLFTSATNPYITIKTNEKEGIDVTEYIKILLEDLGGK
ncbi:MAG: TRCF domain-containing protein, partial [Anaerotignaceae bacterium]